MTLYLIFSRETKCIFPKFHGTSVDIEDCIALIQSPKGKFDFDKLKGRYKETADYDVNPKRMMDNLEGLLMRLGKKL